MPNLQDGLHDLQGPEVFATLNFCQGYWQIPLHKDSQDCQSFITPDGVYTPIRVLHGTNNTTQHLQSVLVPMMEDIKSSIKAWFDDCLLHTKTEDDLLATLNFIFKKFQEHGLKLHASKCVLFASTVRYCGRLITKDGVRFDPKNMEALQTMQEPQNGADFVQYVAAVNWMRGVIPNYSKRVAPLQAARFTRSATCTCHGSAIRLIPSRRVRWMRRTSLCCTAGALALRFSVATCQVCPLATESTLSIGLTSEPRHIQTTCRHGLPSSRKLSSSMLATSGSRRWRDSRAHPSGMKVFMLRRTRLAPSSPFPSCSDTQAACATLYWRSQSAYLTHRLRNCRRQPHRSLNAPSFRLCSIYGSAIGRCRL
jgi:Reverse transcriptase (RNA-dependent DNA polymerase)